MVIVRVWRKDNDANYKMLQSFPNMWAMWEYGAKIIAPICDVCTAGQLAHTAKLYLFGQRSPKKHLILKTVGLDIILIIIIGHPSNCFLIEGIIDDLETA